MKTSKLLILVLAIALVIVSARLVMVSSVSSSTDDSSQDAIDAAVYQNIMTRASVRAYSDKPVEDEKIDKMLHAGMAAPSAVNIQPWHFVVVKDKAMLEKIAEEVAKEKD